MMLPTTLFAVLLAFILFGVGCVALILCYWDRVGKVVGDLWPKLISLGIQFLGGVASIGSAYAVGANKDEWFPAAVAGGVCVAVWGVVKEMVDNRVKAADRADKATLAAAVRESETRTELLTVFREAVHEKVRRLMRATRRHVRPSLPRVRNALTPDSHLEDLLLNLAVFFDALRPNSEAPNRNFRVGLYAARGGVIEPIRAVNMNNPNFDVFTSYRRNPEAFRLDERGNPSQVARCIRQRRTLIVEDCGAAADRGEFAFFHPDQRGYLRSMVAHYLDEVCGRNGTMSLAALVVDTDAAGFFREADRDSLEFCLREFGARVKLELWLHAILSPPDTTYEHADPGPEGEAADRAVRPAAGGVVAGDPQGPGTAPPDHPPEGGGEVA